MSRTASFCVVEKRRGRPRTGHVYRRGDHWVVRIRLADGKRGKPQHLDPRITEERARDLAAQASALALAEGIRRHPKPDPGETADAWMERWTEDRRARGLTIAEQTAGRWRKWIRPIFGHRPMADVTREEVERVVDKLDQATRAKTIRTKTALNIWAIVKAAFRDAVNAKNRDLRVRGDNPTQGVFGPDRGVMRSKPWIYPCEMAQLLASPEVPLWWRRLFALTTYLYLRAGEVAALSIEDVDLVGGVVLVHRSAQRIGVRGQSEDATKPTKTKITHRVPIEPSLLPLLAAMVQEAHEQGRTRLVVLSGAHDLADTLRASLQRAGIHRAELFADDETRAPVTFHDLRATGITWRAIRGDDALKIQRAVGHRSLATTQRYIREAEVIGANIGEPFPPLPLDLVQAPST